MSIHCLTTVLACNLLHQDGDSGTKRAKVDQDIGGEVPAESDMVEAKAMDVDLPTAPSHLDSDANASNVDPNDRAEKAVVDQLPKEMHDMTIRDEKVNDQSEKVHAVFLFFYVPCIFVICWCY